MIHTLIYHGFPLTQIPGRLERDLLHDITNQIDLAYPNDRNLVINGTWMNQDFQDMCDAVLSVYRPTKVWIGSLTDPWTMRAWARNKFQRKTCITILGNTSGEYEFNFWSIYCLEHFQRYDDQDLMLDDDPRVFLCYQNKPKLHRQMLAHKLIISNLAECGVLTLGDSEPFVYDTLSLRPAVKDDYLIAGSLNNASVGLEDPNIWKNCYLNVVSETEIKASDDLFVSEKTWKPIIGLRPFVINGDSRTYGYLRRHGFDVFDDIWPVAKLEQATDLEQRTDIIVDIVRDLSNSRGLKQHWLDLLPRLQYNRNRFFEFAKEQKSFASDLFEKNNSTGKVK